MATDNRSDSLFPDVTEQYGSGRPDQDSSGAFAPLHDGTPSGSQENPGSPIEHVIPVVQVEAPAAQVHDDDAPTDSFAPADVSAPAVESDYIFDPEPISVAEPTPETPAAEPGEDDPYIDAPEWVRVHIPRHLLEMPEQKRSLGGALARKPRRTTKPAAAEVLEAAVTPEPLPATVVEPAIEAVPEPAAPKTKSTATPLLKQPWVIGGGAAAGLALVAAVVVTAFSGSSEETPVPPLPSSTSTADTTTTESEAAAAEAPAWCVDSSEPGRTIGRGPGDPANPVGAIQAFDHAYYVARDGGRVASLMVVANPVPAIQGKIDEWFSTHPGTEHCLTIGSTPDPNVFNVDLLLRWPPGKEGVIRQRVTVAPGEGGFKIAKVEDL